MRNKVGLFSRYVAPSVISFDGSDGATINVGQSSRAGTVSYTGAGHTTSRVFNLAGTSGGATFDASGTGALVLTSAITANTVGAKTLTLAGTNTDDNTIGAIPNASGQVVTVVKSGAGRWKMTGNSGYTGGTTILAGTIVIGTNTQTGSGVFGTTQNYVTVGSDAENATGTAALLIAGGITSSKWTKVPALGTGASQTVALGGSNTSGTATFSDTTSFIQTDRALTLQAEAGGTVKFEQQWNNFAGDGYPSVNFTIGASGKTGTVEIANDLSTTGSITVAYGTLHFSGSLGDATNASGITINGSSAVLKTTSANAVSAPITFTQGTISGTGEIGVAVTVGSNATLSPGNPVGSQSYTSGLTLAGGGAYRWQINNWTGSAGTGFDQLAVSGNDLAITATSGNKFTIELVGLTSGNVSGAVPNFDNTTAKSFTIATSSNLDGFDASKFTIDDSEFVDNNDLDGGTWSLSDSGDDIVLTFTP
jgi:fibronectin-binding autotransporter adhesin